LNDHRRTGTGMRVLSTGTNVTTTKQLPRSKMSCLLTVYLVLLRELVNPSLTDMLDRD
jgi:hypothetical protein